MRRTFFSCCVLMALSSAAISQSVQPDESSAAKGTPLHGAPIDPRAFHYSRRIPDSQAGLTVLVLDAAVLAHSAPDLSDVRIADASDHQIPYLLERRPTPLALNVPLIPETEKPSPKQSRYRLVLPFENLPGAKLVLSTSERTFQRKVSIEVAREASDPRAEPSSEKLASAEWRHDDPESPAPALTLSIRPSIGTNRVSLVVDEGDNHPLALSGARIELPFYRLRFFYPSNGQLRLLYGQDGLSAPRYDLELLAPRLVSLSSHELILTPENSANATSPKSPIQARVFWAALALAVLIILGLLVRLLRSESSAQLSAGGK
jgi:hypothetical protein